MEKPPDHVLSALTGVSIRSPLQSIYPESATGGPVGQDSLLDRYKSHAEKFSREVLKDGVTLPSTPRDIAAGTDPKPVGEDEWYGAGGAADYRVAGRPRVPERVLQESQFGDSDSLRHILDVEDHNIVRGQTSGYAPTVYSGGWRENRFFEGRTDGPPSIDHKIVLDHTVVVGNKDEALKLGREAGERAIFDAKNITDIPTSPPKT